MTAALRRARVLFIVVGVLSPALIALVVLGLIIAWLPELPAVAATHWSGDRPDGFADAGAQLWLAGLCAAVPLLISLPVLLLARDRWSGMPRALGALSLGTSGFLGVTAAGSVHVQRGLTDAAEAPGIGPVVALAALVLAVLALIGWFAQPRLHVLAPRVAGRPLPLPVKADQRVAWFGTARMGTVSTTVLATSILLLLVFSASLLLGGYATWWISAVIAVVIGLLVMSTLVFRVRISAAGVQAASPFGWPRVRIPLADIVDAEAVDVEPVVEFGGYGMRLGLDGRRGIVLRAGTALEVRRATGRAVVITVDHAADAASVVNGLVQREKIS